MDMREVMMHEKLNHLLGTIRSNAWFWVLGSFIALAVLYIVSLLVQEYPLDGPKFSDANPWVLDLCGFLSSIVSAAFCALLVSLLIDADKLDRCVLDANVDSIIESIYDPKRLNLERIPSEKLIEFSHHAIATALNVEKESDGFGLIGICVSEMSEKATSPYAIMNNSRRYQRDQENPDAIHVIDDLECRFINLSNQPHEKQIWKKITSGMIKPHYDKYSRMDCRLSVEIGGSVVKDNDEFVVLCREEGNKRLFVNDNDGSSISIPAHSDDVTTTLHREFYIPASECESTFEWEYPLKELTYCADFEGMDASLNFSMIKCSICDDSSDCSKCRNNAVTMTGVGTAHARLKVNDWIGSTSGLKLTWKYNS